MIVASYKEQQLHSALFLKTTTRVISFSYIWVPVWLSPLSILAYSLVVFSQFVERKERIVVGFFCATEFYCLT